MRRPLLVAAAALLCATAANAGADQTYAWYKSGKYVEAAAEYLHQANMPLIYGLSNVTCEAQREAVSLAEMVAGVIDSHTSL